MKLAHISIETPIEFNDNKIISWVLENPQTYLSFTKELICQNQGDSGNFVLSNNLKTLKIDSDVEMIVGPFIISLNSKKITTMITKRLTKSVSENDYIVKFQEIAKLAKNFLTDLAMDSDIPIEIGELHEENLIKIADFKVAEAKTFYENLVNYISLILNLFRPKLLVLVDIKSYIPSTDFNDFIKFLEYEDVNVLFVDLLTNNTNKCNTQTYFMDSDRCEFIYPSGKIIDLTYND